MLRGNENQTPRRRFRVEHGGRTIQPFGHFLPVRRRQAVIEAPLLNLRFNQMHRAIAHAQQPQHITSVEHTHALQRRLGPGKQGVNALVVSGLCGLLAAEQGQSFIQFFAQGRRHLEGQLLLPCFGLLAHLKLHALVRFFQQLAQRLGHHVVVEGAHAFAAYLQVIAFNDLHAVFDGRVQQLLRRFLANHALELARLHVIPDGAAAVLALRNETPIGIFDAADLPVQAIAIGALLPANERHAGVAALGRLQQHFFEQQVQPLARAVHKRRMRADLALAHILRPV